MAFLALESSEFLATKVKTQLPMTEEPNTRNPRILFEIPSIGSNISGRKINPSPNNRDTIAFTMKTSFNFNAIIFTFTVLPTKNDVSVTKLM